ncbi:DTW domain-containing protein [Angomonas deanei]|uniref:tRNA-uridine aminocarboxypropyltransferase 1 n=1 Tax=Angomonas deanei TaxID=59799 RepID=A0A7G2CBJ2_9TRYP|nr:DTW domain-containing protein [Angomonas deanei]CAD2216879.1 DTW domain containing protein, putative [Angomonas deanei]|eukprot:EPY39700.1 DTW domain-containing protein [Angomonas deanei]
MKRGRGYEEDNSARAKAAKEFIENLHFSKSLLDLRAVTERRPCPKCGKRRLYYCYDCLTVTHPEVHPPPLSLPLEVHVILHPNEIRGKSTSLAASTISPDLHITSYPDVPASLSPEDTLVLYPSAQSVGIEEVEHLERYRHVVFIDSTWQQSKGIARDERVSRFKHVRIKSQTSLFWRFQNNDPSYLATVEAIYYLLREFVVQRNKTQSETKDSKDEKEADEVKRYYHGEVDDLLFYYINQYIEIQERYNTGKEKFTDRHFDGYVLENVDWPKCWST